jgi:hypothetical protein
MAWVEVSVRSLEGAGFDHAGTTDNAFFYVAVCVKGTHQMISGPKQVLLLS